MKKLITILALAGLFQACKEAPVTINDINAATAEQMIMDNSELLIVDVRTPEEYAEGHLAKAQNLNFYDNDFANQLEGLDKDKEYVVYCRVGGRSAKAVAKMQAAGFTNVHNLLGGINGWMEAGAAVVE